MHDSSQPSGPADLNQRLGEAASLWESAIVHVRGRSPNVIETWHFVSSEIGWSLRLVERKRILVYLTPGDGQFRVGLVLGKKAVLEAREAGLSKETVAILDAAPTYAEGHGVRFDVASALDLEMFRELFAIKVARAPKPKRSSKRA